MWSSASPLSLYSQGLSMLPELWIFFSIHAHASLCIPALPRASAGLCSPMALPLPTTCYHRLSLIPAQTTSEISVSSVDEHHALITVTQVQSSLKTSSPRLLLPAYAFSPKLP